MKWVMLPRSESYSEETKCIEVKIDSFPVIKNTIKWITFENWSESSIIFQSFLFASIPAESTSYAPAFFVQMKEHTLFQGGGGK